MTKRLLVILVLWSIVQISLAELFVMEELELEGIYGQSNDQAISSNIEGGLTGNPESKPVKSVLQPLSLRAANLNKTGITLEVSLMLEIESITWIDRDGRSD